MILKLWLIKLSCAKTSPKNGPWQKKSDGTNYSNLDLWVQQHYVYSMAGQTFLPCHLKFFFTKKDYSFGPNHLLSLWWTLSKKLKSSEILSKYIEHIWYQAL